MLQVRDAKITERLDSAEPLPAGLREIVERALTKHREERYQTTGEFYQALVDFSYRYDIKVTGSDLSNFMRRLFAREIEQEKAKLRSKPRSAHAKPGAAQVNVKSAPPAARSTSELIRELPMSEVDESVAEHAAQNFADMAVPSPDAMGSDFYDAGELEATEANDTDPEDDEAPERPQRGGARNSNQSASKTRRSVSSPEHEEHEERAQTKRGSGLGPSTIPFELSSSVFQESNSLEGESPLFEPSTELADIDELITTEFEGTRNPEITRLRHQYASYEGDLARVSFARILARLHQSSATGRLHVSSGSVEKSIFLRAGEPILVVTNKKSERLGAFALRQKRITADQLNEALDRLDEWGGRLGDALVAINAIEAHEIFELLADQMREKLLDVFTWPSGHYGYFENQEPSTMGYPLGINTYSTIVTACREFVPLGLIRRFYEGREHVDVYKISHPPINVNQLQLNARELRVYSDVNSGTNLDASLREAEEARREITFRIFYLLHQVEILKFDDTLTVDLPEL